MGGSQVYVPPMGHGDEGETVPLSVARAEGIVRSKEERNALKEARRRGEIPLRPGEVMAGRAFQQHDAVHAGAGAQVVVQAPAGPTPAVLAMAEMIVANGGVQCPHCMAAFFLDQQANATQVQDPGSTEVDHGAHEALPPEAKAQAAAIAREKTDEGIDSSPYRENAEDYTSPEKLAILDELDTVLADGGGKTAQKRIATEYGVTVAVLRQWKAQRERGELVIADAAEETMEA